MTYFNFLWKMAHVEDAFCGTCQMWKVPLWKMADVEHGKCGTWLKNFCGRWPMWKMAVEQGRHSSSTNCFPFCLRDETDSISEPIL